MTTALPRLKVQPIPGGVITPPEEQPTDTIGDLLAAPSAEPEQPPTTVHPAEPETAPF